MYYPAQAEAALPRAPISLRSSHRYALVTMTAFAAASIGVVFASLAAYSSPGHGGWLITDVVTMSRALTWLHEGSFQPDLPIGVVALYGWTWELTPALCMAVNVLIVGVSAYLLANVLQRWNGDPRFAAVAVFANPYLLLVAAGPNKDIPSLGLSMVVLWLTVVRPKMWGLLALLAAGAEATIRDGYGVILALYVAVFVVVRSPALRVLAGVLVSGAAAVALPALSELYFVSRNLEAATASNWERGASGLLGGLLDETTAPILAYPLRLLYNAATNAVFPVVSMADGEPYWAGIAFWIYGVSLLASLAAAAFIALGPPRVGSPLGDFTLFALAGISAAPFVQPRYLMPVVPAAFALLLSLQRTRRLVIVAGAGAVVGTVIFAYWALGHAPASARPEELSRMPAYLEAWLP